MSMYDLCSEKKYFMPPLPIGVFEELCFMMSVRDCVVVPGTVSKGLNGWLSGLNRKAVASDWLDR